jgi:hypothetical protein
MVGQCLVKWISYDFVLSFINSALSAAGKGLASFSWPGMGVESILKMTKKT